MEKKSILEEIENNLCLCDRHLVSKYIHKKAMKAEDYARMDNIATTMQKEKEHWWNSSFPQVRAYNQFFCSTLILNFDLYRQDMRRLLGRNVTDAELIQREQIKDEVTERYLTWEKMKFNVG